jgi:hypothetical protein
VAITNCGVKGQVGENAGGETRTAALEAALGASSSRLSTAERGAR